MQYKTKSDTIRKLIFEDITGIKNAINYTSSSLKGKINLVSFDESLNASLYERLTDSSRYSSLVFKNDEDWRFDQVIRALEHSIALSDYYIDICCKSKTQTDLNDSLKNILEALRKDAFNYINSNTDLISMCESSKRIKNASFYEKIVFFKSLSEFDINFLKRINPFFEEELQIFDIDITPEFIVDEIDKQNATNLPNESVYQEIALMLASLYRIDEDLINEPISDIIEVLNLDGHDIEMLIDILDSSCLNDINVVLASLIEQYYLIIKDKKIKHEK